MITGRACLGLTIITSVLIVACGAEPTEEEPFAPRVQELRPTDPAHPRGYPQGVEVLSYPSPEGYARVWYATQGIDSPPAADRNQSGVPDFVELVADVADEVNAFLEERAWRLPIEDSALVSTPEAYGGDGRFDIYLKDFGGAGDGHYSVDACVDTTSIDRVTVRQCTGHMVLENNFAPLYYPSLEYAARVVVPHEYFHAVQAAYVSQMPVWWSEGTATWFEEYFYSEQDDFERLTRYYFETPERSLNDRSRGPSDAFGYGAAIFVYFLEQIVGVEGIIEVMEKMALGRSALDAIVEVVEEEYSAFEGAFALFKTWNLFTGSRAVSGRGYPRAERFEEVPVTVIDASRALNWDVQVRPMAARYGRVDFSETIELSTRSIEGFEGVTALAISAPRFAATGHFEVLGPDVVRMFEPEDGPVYLVLSQGEARDDGATRIALRIWSGEEEGGEEGLPAQEESQDRADEGRGCSSVPLSNTSPAPEDGLPWLVVLMMLVFLSRNTRRNL